MSTQHIYLAVLVAFDCGGALLFASMLGPRRLRENDKRPALAFVGFCLAAVAVLVAVCHFVALGLSVAEPFRGLGQ